MEHLIRDIEEYCAQRGVSPSTFGALVGLGGDFVKRLQSGGDCKTRTVEKVRAYIAENPPEKFRCPHCGAKKPRR